MLYEKLVQRFLFNDNENKNEMFRFVKIVGITLKNALRLTLSTKLY